MFGLSFFLHFDLLGDKGTEFFDRLVLQNGHEILVHGKFEPLLVRTWVENGWVFALIPSFFHLMLDLLSKIVILDVIDDPHSNELEIMVNPNQETVINFLMSAQEACVVVNGDLH